MPDDERAETPPGRPRRWDARTWVGVLAGVVVLVGALVTVGSLVWQTKDAAAGATTEHAKQVHAPAEARATADHEAIAELRTQTATITTRLDALQTQQAEMRTDVRELLDRVPRPRRRRVP